MTNDNEELGGRSAIVTGGASGIGFAVAEQLAAAGAEVLILDLDGVAAAQAAAAIEGKACQADLGDPESTSRLGLTADILVNNAGFQRVQPVHEFDVDTFSTMQAVMVEAPFLLIRSCLPYMYQRGYGRIINISSAHGLVASPYKVGYVTAKHAMQGMSKVVALEGGPHGVTSNCINPGYVRTPLVEKQIADQATAAWHHRTRGHRDRDAYAQRDQEARGTPGSGALGALPLLREGLLHHGSLADRGRRLDRRLTVGHRNQLETVEHGT